MAEGQAGGEKAAAFAGAGGVALAVAAASLLWCVPAAFRLGATFDEPLYVAEGLRFWRSHSHDELLRLGTMPLAPDVATLPLHLWSWWTGTPLDPRDGLPELLPWARLGTLVFWGLLLVQGWRVAQSLAGPAAGCLAVALLAVEPALLAHASLATTDVAVSACLLAFARSFAAGRGEAWPRRLGWPALWFGAALLAKASALVLGVVGMAAIEWERLRAAGVGLRAGVAGWRRDALAVVGAGIVVAFLGAGTDWQAEPSFVAWAHRLPAGPGADLAVAVADHLTIFRNAGNAIVRQVRHNAMGNGAYLLGHEAPRAIFGYFPVALAIKLSLPLLLGPLILAAWRPPALANWPLAAAGAMALLSLTFRVQIGVRMVLPLVALLAVGLAVAAVRALATARPAVRRAGFAACLLAVASTAVEAALVWPHGLLYANRLWGGTATSYRLLSDSNHDWGQGLPELAAWQRERAAPLSVWYFGTDPLLRRLPLKVLPLHQLEVADVGEAARGSFLAVSTTLLHGVTLSQPHRRAAAFLRTQTPLARTSTFLIYDFRSRP